MRKKRLPVHNKKNQQGYTQLPIWDPVEDRFQPGITQTARLDEANGGGAYHEVDHTTDAFFSSLNSPAALTSVIQSIMVEIAEEREAGVLRPFVEGEPIGMIQKRKPFTSPPETRAQRYERKQEEIRALRASNDAAIRRILGA